MATATKTNPELWERCKRDAVAKMGGKHSARAMQLATQLYKKRGGGYSGSKPTAKNNSLKKWGKQKWQWSGGEKKKTAAAVEQGGRGVYLPEDKIKRLKATKEGKKKLRAAARKKAKANREGRQYSSHGLAAGTSLKKKEKKAAVSKSVIKQKLMSALAKFKKLPKDEKAVAIGGMALPLGTLALPAYKAGKSSSRAMGDAMVKGMRHSNQYKDSVLRGMLKISAAGNADGPQGGATESGGTPNPPPKPNFPTFSTGQRKFKIPKNYKAPKTLKGANFRTRAMYIQHMGGNPYQRTGDKGWQKNRQVAAKMNEWWKDRNAKRLAAKTKAPEAKPAPPPPKVVPPKKTDTPASNTPKVPLRQRQRINPYSGEVMPPVENRALPTPKPVNQPAKVPVGPPPSGSQGRQESPPHLGTGNRPPQGPPQQQPKPLLTPDQRRNRFQPGSPWQGPLNNTDTEQGSIRNRRDPFSRIAVRSATRGDFA